MEQSQNNFTCIDTFTATNTTLLELNDDCLSRMCGFLNVLNLINLSDTCSRLRRIAECKYKKITKLTWINTEQQNSVNLHKVISRIGSQITCLAFMRTGRSQDYCSLIHKECTRVNSLIITASDNYVSLIGDSNFLPWLRATKLQHLSIELSEIDDRFLEINTLKELSISACCLSESKLRLLLTKNNRIEVLDLFHLDYVYTLQILVNLKMLHTLSIQINMNDVSRLGLLVEELQHLRKLTLSCIPTWKLRIIFGFEEMELNYFLELISERRLESLAVNAMIFNETTFACLALLKLKSLTLVSPTFAGTITNIPFQLANTFNYIERLKLILSDITVTIEEIFLMVTELPQLVNLNLCNAVCEKIDENRTLNDIFKTLDEILTKQKGRAAGLKLTMPLSTTKIFHESNVREFLLSPILQLLNPLYVVSRRIFPATSMES